MGFRASYTEYPYVVYERGDNTSTDTGGWRH